MSRAVSTKAGSIESLKVFRAARLHAEERKHPFDQCSLRDHSQERQSERSSVCFRSASCAKRCAADRRLALVVGSRPTRTGFTVEGDKALLEPLPPPMTNRRIADAKPMSDRDVGFAIRRGENDLSSPEKPVRRRLRTREAAEFLPLRPTEGEDSFLRATRASHDPRSDPAPESSPTPAVM